MRRADCKLKQGIVDIWVVVFVCVQQTVNAYSLHTPMASDESFYLQNLFYTQNAEPMEFSMRLCREWETLYEEITVRLS